MINGARRRVRSARITAPEAPLEISDSQIPRPAGGQVVVRVRSAGVCHSDLHLWEGGYDTGGGFMKVTDRGVRYPVTPGHEIVGTVHEAGPEAGEFAPGDEVLVYPWCGCGSCSACSAGSENLCDSPRSLGIFADGGYAEYVLVPSHKYLARASGLDADGAASLACSGLTAYTAVKKASADDPRSLVVVGAGGLGLMGVQLARAQSNAELVCVDIDDEKLDAAKKMGADRTINSKSADAAKQVSDACGGADAVIDFVNAPPTAKLALSVLRKRGRLVMVGLFGGAVELPLVTVPLRAMTIEGAYTGTFSAMQELVELARKGVVKPVVSKKYGLDGANEALGDLKAGKIVGRAVINP